MLWDVHLHDPRTRTARTETVEVPDTHRGDNRYVTQVASRRFRIPERYVLAVPHTAHHNPLGLETWLLIGLGGVALAGAAYFAGKSAAPATVAGSSKTPKGSLPPGATVLLAQNGVFRDNTGASLSGNANPSTTVPKGGIVQVILPVVGPDGKVYDPSALYTTAVTGAIVAQAPVTGALPAENFFPSVAWQRVTQYVTYPFVVNGPGTIAVTAAGTTFTDLPQGYSLTWTLKTS